MLDRQWMMDREDRRDKELRDWQERMEAKCHRSALFWLGLVATAAIVIATILAAFIQREGQPTIINNIPAPHVIEQSIPDTGGSPPQ